MKNTALFLAAFSMMVWTLGCDAGGGGGPTDCEQMGGFCSSFTEGCSDDTLGWTELGCGGEMATCCIPTDSCAALNGYCSNWNDICKSGYGPVEGTDCNLCCVPLDEGMGEPPYDTYDNPLTMEMMYEIPPVMTRTSISEEPRINQL